MSYYFWSEDIQEVLKFMTIFNFKIQHQERASRKSRFVSLVEETMMCKF